MDYLLFKESFVSSSFGEYDILETDVESADSVNSLRVDCSSRVKCDLLGAPREVVLEYISARVVSTAASHPGTLDAWSQLLVLPLKTESPAHRRSAGASPTLEHW